MVILADADTQVLSKAASKANGEAVSENEPAQEVRVSELPWPRRDQVQGPINVLVIEDAPDVVKVVSLCLELRWPDATILSAAEGNKGLELIEKQKPDIVILDLGLPDMDGLDVLREIRRFSDVPIIVLTVRDRDSDIARGLELGADDYMTKPFSHIELQARVNRVLRRAREAVTDNNQPAQVACVSEPPWPRRDQMQRPIIVFTAGEGAAPREVYHSNGDISPGVPLNEGLLAEFKMAIQALEQFQTTQPTQPRPNPISPRETEILEHVANGEANKRIAFILSISEQTVKNHVSSIMEKLGASDRTHAVVLALRLGLLSV